MIRIRSELMNELSSHSLATANVALIDYARKRFPEEFIITADSEMLEFVKRIRSLAGRYGIDREDNVATFLDLSVMYGEDFHESPWASEVLSTDALHGPDKMALLRHRVGETGVNL